MGSILEMVNTEVHRGEDHLARVDGEIREGREGSIRWGRVLRTHTGLLRRGSEARLVGGRRTWVLHTEGLLGCRTSLRIRGASR